MPAASYLRANRTGILGKELKKDEPRGARRTLATFDWAGELCVRAEGPGFLVRSGGVSRLELRLIKRRS